ncbi:Saposin-like_type B domin-containing protein [Hexamita inflata]|uniref:Saposin-like type B domin-containing protein n=1 Tax=Hexamita inflata TaxID=28002 RepID=A0AA86N8Q0_9EUKA|nr:Saposin-like type B domin-containing protein [Hexamita inflata]
MFQLIYVMLSNEIFKIDLKCDVCVIVIDSVYAYVEDQDNEQAVAEFLGKVCEYIPQDLFNWCEQIIQNYYYVLIQEIVEGHPPYEICQSLTLC